MNLGEGLRLGLLEIRKNKLRSFLTLFGVAVGITSVMAMSGIMAAFQEGMEEGLSRMGRGRVFVWAKQANGNRGRSMGILYEDALAVRRAFPELLTVSPIVQTETNVFLGDFNAKAHVAGVTPDWTHLDWKYDVRGRFLSAEDVRESAAVCVLIRKRKDSTEWWRQKDPLDSLFSRHDPLGRFIRIHNSAFRVVGVLQERPRSQLMNSDWGQKNVLIPITAYQKRLTHLSRQIHMIDMDTGEESSSYVLAKRVTGLLKRRHRGVVDFEVKNFADMMGGVMKWAATLSAVMLAVAAIALFAGGVGIMNITLASIHARVKEIGVRKSVGARERDIMRQFLLEAVTLSLSGGVLGVMAGCGLCGLVKLLADMAVLPSLASIATALAVSSGVGVVFAWFPARLAARLDPVEALRYE